MTNPEGTTEALQTSRDHLAALTARARAFAKELALRREQLAHAADEADPYTAENDARLSDVEEWRQLYGRRSTGRNAFSRPSKRKRASRLFLTRVCDWGWRRPRNRSHWSCRNQNPAFLRGSSSG